jgi:Acetyltransferase (GNAT) domain
VVDKFFEGSLPLFWRNEYAMIHGETHRIHKAVIPALHSEDVTALMPYRTSSDAKTFYSPGRATFGGFWTTSRLTSSDYLQLFYDLKLHFSACEEFVIRLPPSYFFAHAFDSQRQALIELSRGTSICDTNSHIVLSSNEPPQISKGNRKKIRQFFENGGCVNLVLHSDTRKINLAYDVLSENRRARGVELSMPRDLFIKSLKTLPQDFSLHTAEINDDIAAASLTLKLSSNVMYVLFWGDSLKYRTFSPVASLATVLMKYCESMGCSILDLGTSSVDGIVDDGLLRFKRNLGAIESPRYSFTFRNGNLTQ